MTAAWSQNPTADELLERAWGVIANADWDKQTDEWLTAARGWRDAWLASRGSVPAGAAPETERLRAAAIAAVEAEPELPGEMPEEMAACLAHPTPEMWTEVLRTTVRLTKDGIAKRLRAALGSEPLEGSAE